jgi:isopenicillin N synthase-like dioxygenase
VSSADAIPIVDVASLVEGRGDGEAAGQSIGRACREHGFFYVTGHGVPAELLQRLDVLSREFFAQDLATKMAIRMELGGRAWRGYFPVGDELTSGLPDQKEGIYFGSELPADDPRVRAGVPLHGQNLFPAIADFKESVLAYMDAMTRLGHQLMAGIAWSLELDANYFRRDLTQDPTILFRIFHYPPLAGPVATEQWSVGEHTDYGILTILRQDDVGGLEVKSQGRWIPAPPVPGTFVCNIGDMLDRMTGGLYRSTPHRVRNMSAMGRLSFPFFFDPSWHAEVKPIFPDRPAADDSHERWDKTNLHVIGGRYGDYLLAKVSKVFPQLSRQEL